MGVHGLTSYIFNNSTLYLKPYELSDCDLIIDGLNVAYYLARKVKSHSAFGGDYDEYFRLVKSFMLTLKKCGVNPIVIIDGACEKAKLKTRLSRRRGNIIKLEYFSEGFSTEEFNSLFATEVFLNAARDVGITCVQSYFEADGEIAALAKTLNCPVLGNDSDYFIYDVLYIPFSTVKYTTPIKYSHSGKFYLQCLIYDIDDFLKTIGFEKPLLPILATLLGNDYVNNAVFSKFFNHVQKVHIKNKSHTQKRIHELMQWLKKENLNSAMERIISHLPKKRAEKVLKLFDTAANLYNSPTISESVLSELTCKFGDIHLPKNNFKIDWPPEIAKLYAQCFIPSFFANIVRHQFYLTPLQVENIHDQSSHFKSLDLIEKIYSIITPYLKCRKPLKLYLRVKKEYIPVKIQTNLFPSMKLESILKEPCKARLNLLCELVGVHVDDIKFVQTGTWPIFIMSLIYWSKEYKNSVSLAHVHAFIIMLIANQIVKCKVSCPRKKSKFVKCQTDELNGMIFTLEESSEFKQMLENVSYEECLLVNTNLMPLRQTTKEISGKEYSIFTIHLFNSFQSCLYYISIINALLKYPLPPLKIEHFYSGTLLFNLYVCIKTKPDVEKFGSTLFECTPNLSQIYYFLSKNLSKNLEKTEKKGKEKVKKKRKNKSSCKVLQNIHYSSTSEDEYTDDNNFFAVLCKVDGKI